MPVTGTQVFFLSQIALFCLLRLKLYCLNDKLFRSMIITTRIFQHNTFWQHTLPMLQRNKVCLLNTLPMLQRNKACLLNALYMLQRNKVCLLNALIMLQRNKACLLNILPMLQRNKVRYISIPVHNAPTNHCRA